MSLPLTSPGERRRARAAREATPELYEVGRGFHVQLERAGEEGGGFCGRAERLYGFPECGKCFGGLRAGDGGG